MARSPDPRAANRGNPVTLPAVLAGVLLLLAGATAVPAHADDTNAAQSPPAASCPPRTVVQRAKDAVQQSNDATTRHAGQDADVKADAAPARPDAAQSDAKVASASGASTPAAKAAAKNKSRKGNSLVIVSGSSSTSPATVAAPAKRAPVTAANAAHAKSSEPNATHDGGAVAAKAASKPRSKAAKAAAGGAASDPAASRLASAAVRTVTPVDAVAAAGSDVKTSPTVNVPKLAPQEERVTYQYNALGRRDPFRALIGGGFVGMDVGGDAPPDVGGLTVVGIVWGAQDKFALCEDPRGNSMVLRKGDKVMNGVVEELKRDGVVITLSTDGQTQSVTIPLTQKGEQAQ